MDELYKKLADWMQTAVSDYEGRVQRALNIIGTDRCSLDHADRKLYNAMYDAVEEYLNDNAIDVDIDDIDIETILFTS